MVPSFSPRNHQKRLARAAQSATLMGASAIGSISQSYRTIGPPRSEEDSQRVITATIAEPEQPIAMFAKWEVTELDRILEHCRGLQN